jgi:serralysin
MKKNIAPFPLLLSFLCLTYCSRKDEKSYSAEENSFRQKQVSESFLKKDKAAHQNDQSFMSQFCTEMLPPPPPNEDLSIRIDTTFVKRENGKIDTLISIESTGLAYAGYDDRYDWEKRILNVMFLDGDPLVIERVKKAAREWEKSCSIRFNFGNFQNPDITISFLYKGSWSQIGTYSSKVQPSMNFGWLQANSSDLELNRVVYHEFGHALGLVHEHQLPDNPIDWNRPVVYDYYSGPPNNWDRAKVDKNVFLRYNKSHIRGDGFDRESIMLYAIPPGFASNFTQDWNNQLSPRDKSTVAGMYP